MAGTDLFTHVRYMLWTTVPSILLTFVIFLLIGLFSDVQGSEIAGRELSDAIRGKFYISPWLFVVPAFVLVAVVMKVDATVALFAAMILGAATAVVFQPGVVRELADRDGSYAVQSYVAVHRAIGEATVLTIDHPAAAELIQTKGMAGMLSTIWLIVCAMCFGGAMEGCGLLQRLTQPLVRWAQSTASLIAATAASCLVVNITASDQYLAIVVPGRMFRKTFRERGLAPQNLSRTLEDSGTVTSVLVPWNTVRRHPSGGAQGRHDGVCPVLFLQHHQPLHDGDLCRPEHRHRPPGAAIRRGKLGVLSVFFGSRQPHTAGPSRLLATRSGWGTFKVARFALAPASASRSAVAGL